jgi:hypothetical protein
MGNQGQRAWEEYKKQHYSSNTSTTQKTTASSNATQKATSSTNAGAAAWEKYKKEAGLTSSSQIATAQSWSDSSIAHIKDVESYLSKWHGKDDAGYSSIQKKNKSLLEQAYFWRNEYAGDEEAKSYINEIISALKNAETASKEYFDYYGKWGTEDEYNTAKRNSEWLQKYEGSSIEDLRKLTLDDEEEQKWVESYIQYLDDEEKGNYDLVAGQKEIDELEAQLAEMEQNKLYESLQQRINPAKPTEPTRQDIGYNPHTMWQQGTVQTSGISEEEKLRQLIAQKQQYLNQAKRIQESNAYADTVNNADFDQFDDYVESDDILYNWINDAQFREDYESMYDAAQQTVSENTSLYVNITSKFTRKNYDRMNKNEIAIFNYYYAKGGKEAAQKYLDNIQETLNTRTAVEMFGIVKDDVALEMVFGAAAGFNQFGTNVMNNFKFKADYIPQSAYQIASGMVREDLADNGKLPEWLGGNSLAQIAYDAVTTTANMAPSILVGIATGGTAGTALMGLSAAGGAYQQALNEGFDKAQARGYSILVGASEAVLEKVLGGISAVGGNALGLNAVKNIANADNAFKAIAKRIGSSMISEFSEEYMQEVLDPLFRNLMMHTGEDVKLVSSEAIYSGILGALTGAFMEAPFAIYGETKTASTGRKIKEAGSVNDLAKIGNTFAPETVAYKLAGKVTNDTGAYTIGQLFNEVNARLTEQNISEIAEVLVENDVDERTARQYAEAFAYVVENGSMPDALANAIEADPLMAKAATKVLFEDNTTWNQRSQGYRDVLMKLAEDKVKGKTAPTSKASVPADNTAEEKTESGAEGNVEPAKYGNIQTIKNGKVTVKMTDGSEVDLKDADLDPEDSVRIETIASIDGISAEDASGIFGILKAGSKNSQYDAIGAREAYRYGYYGLTEKMLDENGTFSKSLTPEQRKAVYEIGNKARQQNVESKTFRKTDAKKAPGKVHYDGDRTVLNERQQVSLKAMDRIASALGVQIYIFESEVGKNGKRIGENGWYDPKDGSIHIDLYAGQDGGATMLFTLAHELTHYIRQWSPKKFKVLADFLMEEYGKKGVNVSKLIREQRNKAKRNGRTISYDTAYEEVVADAMEMMLSDGNVMKRLEKVKAKDKELWSQIKRFIDHMAAKIRAVYKDMKPDSKEAEFVMEMGDTIYRLQELFAEGLVDASENFQSAEKNTTEDGGVKFSQKKFNKDVDSIVYSDDNAPFDYRNVFMGETPQALLDVGFIQLPMTITSKHIYTIANKEGRFSSPNDHYHELGATRVKELPDMVKEAVATFIEKDNPRRVVIVTSRVDSHGQPIMVAVEYSGQTRYKTPTNEVQIYANPVTTALGKKDNWFVTQIEEAVRDGRMLQADKKRSQESPSGVWAQCPESLWSSDFTTNIDRFKQNVKRFLPKEKQIRKSWGAIKETEEKSKNLKLSDRDNAPKSYAEITEEQQKLYQREREIAERKRVANNNPELLKAMDDYRDMFAEMKELLPKRRQGTATQTELDRIEEIKKLRDEQMKHIADLQESLGLNEISREETEIREEKEALRVAADEAWAREGAEKENKAIEKSGLSAAEYFREKALKAFKTTTNFNEAGYLLPDGKLLNFSGGERNHRYRDHREIGEIYEATQGASALNRFMSDGNIRIMAESPGVDITSGIEPTKEQYNALWKFIKTNGVKDGKFFVDFSDKEGHRAGNYSYNGRINADRIINDIKYFYQTGAVRESSGLTAFLSDRDTESVTARSLLSSTDVATIKNEVAKKKLADYQKILEVMNAEDQKLREIRAEIKELSFAKGTRDTQKLKDLKFEAIKINNHISVYEGQLQRIEKELQSVVKRERAKVVKEAEKRDKAVLAKEWMDAQVKQNETLREYRETRAALRQQESDTAVMEKEFIRITKEYEKLDAKSGKTISELRTKLKNEAEKHRADEKMWMAEFGRLMREYEAADRSIDRLEQKIERQKAVAKERVEGRNKTAMRHKIQNVVKELNSLLLSNDKKRHVPDNLKKAVAETLDLVNMDTVGADERAAKYADLIAKEQAKANPDQDKIDSYISTMENILRKGEKMGQRLNELHAAYEEIQNSDDPDIANAYDPVIAGAIQELSATIGNTSIKNMSIEQLSDVYDVYRAVLTRVRDANKAMAENIKASIEELAKSTIREVQSVGGSNKYRISALDAVRKFDWDNLKPVYAMERIGSSTLTEVFNNVRAGEDVWARDVSEARAYYLEKSKKYGYDKWDFEKKYRFESNSGIPFELTLEQMMSLYAYSKREQAGEHLRLGGFVFDSNIETTKVKDGKKSILKYKVNTADAHQITPEIMADIIGNLTREQAMFVDEMQDYLSTVMGAKGNEVTSKMYGIKLFKEKFYFPLKSAKQFMFEQNEVSGEVRIKNSGFTNKVVTNANNPVILSNFMDVWSGHVNDMSMYHAFTLPLEDFNRVFNYNTPKKDGIDPVSVKGTIQNAYSPAAVQYVKNLITDLNGGARTDSTTGVINKLTGLFKKGAVFASLSVVVQQPSAIARAAALIDTKYFIGPKIDQKRHKYLWDEVKQYAPVALIKEMGYFDTNMGKSTQDYITGKEYSGFSEQMKALVTDSNYRDEILSKAPAFADEVAWCGIWEAVKRETKAKHPSMDTKSEAFLKLAGQRFTEVITKTQVYDSVLARSANMRSKDTGMKMATAFMAEPTTSINMIEDAIMKGRRGDKRYARTAIGAVIASQILNSILVSFVYAARDDDEDETYLEKYIGSLAGGIIDGLNPATYIPFIKDIVSIVQGYDVERSDMAVVSDLWNAWKSLSNENVSMYRKVEGFAGSIAQIFGLPVKNIMRDVRGIYNAIMTLPVLRRQQEPV